MYIKSIFALSLVALCTAEPPTNNYLPPSPTQGYSYPSPSVPFPPPKPPSPPPSYAPPAPPSGPSYRPPAPPTGPSAPAPRPSYGPPSGPNLIPTGTGHQSQYGENDHLNHVHVPGMPYDFSYVVKDDYFGTDYSHNAASDGDVVKGEYRVQLPDGRLQIVRYTADWKTGFHADVQYEGQASYPPPSVGYPAGKPSYGPPPTTGGGY